MEYTRLGSSGLVVSKIVLGCMGFGEPARGNHPWSVGIDVARPLVKRALEAGITTFDTANVYSLGSSEEIVGELLGEFASRDEVVIATKVHGRMGAGPNGGGLSRGAIMTQVDASLRRLRTDYIDLYQIHRFDPETPIAETMEALHDLVRAGKVRYLGASSMWTWQFASMQHSPTRRSPNSKSTTSPTPRKASDPTPRRAPVVRAGRDPYLPRAGKEGLRPVR